MSRAGSKYRVLTVGADGTAGVEYVADFVIFAAPTFLAHYIIEGAPPAAGFVYSPWFTANLRLDRLPRELEGAEPAWDNVDYDSPSLGYVNATHMSVASYTRAHRLDLLLFAGRIHAGAGSPVSAGA